MMKRFLYICGALALLLGSVGQAQAGSFHPSTINGNGIIKVDSHDTYYDNSNGTLFEKILLPTGATELQFRVTGGVITDGSDRLASPDGLYSNGQAPYNFTNTYYGSQPTYQGTPMGKTTGADPALFGVFFSPTFSGTPQDSLNYRSDSGISPDPRTLSTYTPSLNQPFFIGDGYNQNNAFSTASDKYTPSGTRQTFVVPTGATYLLLGIGADVNMGDNQNNSDPTQKTGYTVHAFDNGPKATPEPSTLVLLGMAGVSFAGYGWRRRKQGRSERAWQTTAKDLQQLP